MQASNIHLSYHPAHYATELREQRALTNLKEKGLLFTRVWCRNEHKRTHRMTAAFVALFLAVVIVFTLPPILIVLAALVLVTPVLVQLVGLIFVIFVTKTLYRKSWNISVRVIFSWHIPL